MLSVSRSGSGAPLILLHGWGLHSGVWQNLLTELEKQFHCFAVDMLGHGDSQGEDVKDFSLENMRNELHQLVKEIDSEKIILLGWSLGGLVAMDFVNHYPEHINKLILVAANASFCQQINWPDAMDESVLNNFAEQLEQDYKKTVDKFMALQMFGADNYKQSLKTLKQSISSRPEPAIKTLRQGLKILKVTDLREQIKNISQPVLIITGEHDRLMPHKAGNAMQALFKNARCNMIKGAGHAPFISHPEEFVRLIKEFTKE